MKHRTVSGNHSKAETMKNKAHDLRSWSFSGTERILPDANFWINVFGPAAAVGGRGKRVAEYTRGFQRMLHRKVPMFIDALILSEFVNVLARQEFNTSFLATYGPRGFKAFRNSPDFPPIASMIAGQCRKILKCSASVDHSFSEWDMDRLLGDFAGGGEDFNDQLIVEICQKHGFTLLTDDGDMTRGGLQVITANPGLIASCPN